MTREELREKVAEAMWMADPDEYDPADRRLFSEADWEARRNYLAEADAAIALVLEEAAKVAESNAPACQDMEGTAIAERCDLIAAAIRALKDQATT